MRTTTTILFFLVAISMTRGNPVPSSEDEDESKNSAEVLTDYPIVNIPGLGMVQGKIAKSYVTKRPYSSFLGLRYAKAPSGPRRFQPPEFEDPWEGIRVTKFFGRKCPQTGLFRSDEKFADVSRNDPRNWHALLEEKIAIEEGSNDETEDSRAVDLEDCLFVQIYSPNLNATKKMPVMVFFHGGAFAGGSSNVYGAAKLMEKDVVLVVPHYRLGPLTLTEKRKQGVRCKYFNIVTMNIIPGTEHKHYPRNILACLGFLSLQTDEIPGNAGLLDQVLALKWVQAHISAFGGDPDQVTIFGESAGAASVSYLMVSPLGKGLFKHVIAESGSALSDWAIDLTPENHTINIAEEVGCKFVDSDGKPDIPEITKCLQTVDAMNLTKAYQVYKYKEEERGHTGFGGCSPIIQRAGKLRYIEEHPEVLVRSGRYNKVPIMFGSNRDEGTYVLAIVYFGYMMPNNVVEDEEFLNYRMSDIALRLFNTKDPNFWLVDALEYRYEPIETRGNFTLMMPALIDILGAAFLKGPTHHFVQFNSQYQDSYFYTFNYRGSKSLWSMIGNGNSPFPGGICHANELMYVFNMPTFTLNEEDDKVSRRLVDIWTNFATYGNPNPRENPSEGVPEWPKYSMEDRSYLRIMQDFTVEHDFTKEFTISVDEGMTPDP